MAGEPVRVRRARLDDLESLLVLGEKMRVESPHYYPPVERESVMNSLKFLDENPVLGFCAVAETDRLIGFISATIGRYFFSSKLNAVMAIFYVDSAYRKSRAGILLFKEFEKWGQERGAELFQAHYHYGENDLLPFFKRFGYEPYGMQLVKCAIQFLP